MACLCAVLVGAGILLIARYFALKKRNLRALDAEVVNICTIKPPTKMYRIGVRDKFGESGSAAVLLHKYELDGEGVYKQVKAFVESC